MLSVISKEDFCRVALEPFPFTCPHISDQWLFAEMPTERQLFMDEREPSLSSVWQLIIHKATHNLLPPFTFFFDTLLWLFLTPVDVRTSLSDQTAKQPAKGRLTMPIRKDRAAAPLHMHCFKFVHVFSETVFTGYFASKWALAAALAAQRDVICFAPRVRDALVFLATCQPANALQDN